MDGVSGPEPPADVAPEKSIVHSLSFVPRTVHAPSLCSASPGVCLKRSLSALELLDLVSTSTTHSCLRENHDLSQGLIFSPSKGSGELVPEGGPSQEDQQSLQEAWRCPTVNGLARLVGGDNFLSISQRHSSPSSLEDPTGILCVPGTCPLGRL